MTARSSRVITASLVWLACGCASLGLDRLVAPRFESVDEPESRFRVVAPGGSLPAGGVSLRIWSRVENPNPLGLEVTELAGRLFLEDAPVEVTLPLGLPLVARQDTIIPIDITLGFERLPRLAEIASRSVLRGDAVAYRLEGTVGVDAGPLGIARFGPATILTGELSPVR